MKIKTAPLGNLGANFYMVKDDETNEMFVVDPGASPEIVIDLIKDSGCNLRYIILTHAHADHIGALDELKKAYDVPVVVHNAEKERLNSDACTLCSMLRIKTPETCADICVSDGETLEFGRSNISFIHTPGHTPGSMCIKYENVLFSGDTIFNLSIGRTDFPGGSYDDIISSVKNKIYTLAPDTKIYPGHGDETTVEHEIMNSPFVRGK